MTTNRPSLDNAVERWQILAERVLVERPPWLRLCEQTVRLPDGRIVDDFLVAQAPPYATVFGLRPDGLVVAVEEYKHGPGRTVLKLPAGFLNEGETPIEGARRELLEETGYVAESWHFLGSFFDDGNRGMSQGFHFLATGLRQVAQPDAGDLATVRPLLLSPEDIRRAVLDGWVGESGTAAAILLALDRLNHTT
ncbi:MAG: NUDIX hydrolase [Caldilineae bacterium]|nr:MAG: NUDIX hydrolase [Caldilineae bacterium]